MRLRTTCKCGAEFDAMALFPANVGSAWDVWVALHARCMNVVAFERANGDVKVKWGEVEPS